MKTKQATQARLTNDKLSHRILATALTFGVILYPPVFVGIITWNLYAALGAALVYPLWSILFNVAWTWHPFWKKQAKAGTKTPIQDLFLARIEPDPPKGA